MDVKGSIDNFELRMFVEKIIDDKLKSFDLKLKELDKKLHKIEEEIDAINTFTERYIKENDFK